MRAQHRRSNHKDTRSSQLQFCTSVSSAQAGAQGGSRAPIEQGTRAYPLRAFCAGRPRRARHKQALNRKAEGEAGI